MRKLDSSLETDEIKFQEIALKVNGWEDWRYKLATCGPKNDSAAHAKAQVHASSKTKRA
jgi:hypothetical protein